MTTAISVDELIDDPGYPGLDSEHLGDFVLFEPLKKLSAADLDRFWLLEYRWPNGATPLGLCFFEDGLVWSTQYAAYNLPLPPTNGFSQRFAGTHVYGTELTLASAWELDFRAERLAQSLPAFLDDFESIWERRSAELLAGARYFETYPTRGRTLAELAQFLLDARSFQRRAWEIHFELMYPLLVNHAGFYELCDQLGIPREQVGKFLQGYPTKITECDRKLWELTEDLRASDAATVLQFSETPSAATLQAIENSGPAGQAWAGKFQAFLDEWGWRSDNVADPKSPAWIEDPATALGNIKTFLSKTDSHDFASRLQVAVDEREAAIDAARSKLTRSEQEVFEAALATCQKANFIWWNEDHNFYIDMRATLPLRRAALAIGQVLDLAAPEDTLFCFFSELYQLACRSLDWNGLTALIQDRRDYYDHWADQRKHMPKFLGAPPDSLSDPILTELDGVTEDFLAAVRAGPAGLTRLGGMPASPGKARGTARVLHGADELHRIQPGEILVCEGTSPSWTPAFTKIAGCVCDQGGALSHAAIVSREYRVPCVVGVGVATATLRDGDIIELDGDKGSIIIHRTA